MSDKEELIDYDSFKGSRLPATMRKGNFIRTVPTGFSWTSLFFGIFVPFFRGDSKWFFMQFAINTPVILIGIFFSSEAVVIPIILAICLWLYFAAEYNNLYRQTLYDAGWEDYYDPNQVVKKDKKSAINPILNKFMEGIFIGLILIVIIAFIIVVVQTIF